MKKIATLLTLVCSIVLSPSVFAQTTVTFDDQGYVQGDDITTDLASGINGFKFVFTSDVPPAGQDMSYDADDGEAGSGSLIPGYTNSGPPNQTIGLLTYGNPVTTNLNSSFNNVDKIVLTDEGGPYGFDALFDSFVFQDVAVPPIQPDANNILYVNKTVGGGDGSGDSWANAIPELADALAWANLNQDPNWATTPLKIFVAIGTYNPLYSPDDGNFGNPATRDNAFLMVNNVQLYGGFDPASGIDDLSDARILPGSGTAGTILSGDLNGDDGPNFANNPENTFHVLVSSGAVGNARLDGFAVTGGNANGTPSSSLTVNGHAFYKSVGGGMYNYDSSSPSIANSRFSDNTAYYGGGMNNDSPSPSIANSILWGNTATTDGNEIYISGTGTTSLDYCIYGNDTGDVVGGTPTVTNSLTIARSLPTQPTAITACKPPAQPSMRAATVFTKPPTAIPATTAWPTIWIWRGTRGSTVPPLIWARMNVHPPQSTLLPTTSST